METPQFDLPFRLASDGAALVETEQDELDEVAQSVETLLRTPLGFVEENPDYGVSDQTFTEGDVDLDEIQTAISQWEGDRADALLDQEPDLLDQFVRRVRINVNVRSDD